MRFRKKIGIGLIAAPFITLASVALLTTGLKGFLFTFGITTVVVLVIGIGVMLLTKDDKNAK